MKKRIEMITKMAVAPLLIGGVLAGCSTSTDNGGNSSVSSTPAATKTAVGTSGNPSSCTSPVELNMFVDATWYPFQEWSGEIPEAITKATCVKPKVTVATDDKQLALMTASGDLPDIVVSFNFKLMSDAKLSLPYNQIFPKYAPDVKFDPIKELVSTVTDGNYYAIRNDFSTEAEWKANPYA
ncbi:hypothetical protein AB4Z22_29075, partial [Paenibacillus sp. TAF58]